MMYWAWQEMVVLYHASLMLQPAAAATFPFAIQGLKGNRPLF
jgi:hypothetical protein